jgi:site-specific DNA-methyltransferase (adenine-specific)
LKRIISASSREGDLVLDFFAGSGTTGAVSQQLGRRFCLVDNNWEAVEVMAHRLGMHDVHYIGADGESVESDLEAPEKDQEALF